MVKPRARWSLQDAKAQFSEVVRRSLDAGPQVVTRNGQDVVVVLSMKEFRRLSSSDGKTESFARFLAESPLAEVSLDISRPRDPGRSIKL